MDRATLLTVRPGLPSGLGRLPCSGGRQRSSSWCPKNCQSWSCCKSGSSCATRNQGETEQTVRGVAGTGPRMPIFLLEIVRRGSAYAVVPILPVCSGRCTDFLEFWVFSLWYRELHALLWCEVLLFGEDEASRVVPASD
jgi:hypothetical protein